MKNTATLAGRAAVLPPGLVLQHPKSRLQLVQVILSTHPCPPPMFCLDRVLCSLL